MQGWERAINTPSVRRPQPHNTNPQNERRESENSNRQKVSEQLGQWRGIGPALATRQSHTIEHWVTKIVPQRHWPGHKSAAIPWDSAARRRIGVPMCDHTTVCNPHRNIRHRKSNIKRVHRVTPDLVQHTLYCHRSNMCKVTLKHTPS